MAKPLKEGIRSEGRRKLKKRLLKILETKSVEAVFEEIRNESFSDVINPLFSFLYHKDESVKWAAVSIMGALVSEQADKDMESARVVFRRLMWNLNDESGGIGWGSPEAMGEILARSRSLCDEFSRVLISYALEDGNYIEYEMLQRGLLWGIYRLIKSGNYIGPIQVSDFIPYLKSTDSLVRGLAALIVGYTGDDSHIPLIEMLTRDRALVEIYQNNEVEIKKVQDLAQSALEMLQIDSQQKG